MASKEPVRDQPDAETPEQLSLQEEKLIRGYMLKLVLLPGAFVVAISGIGGYLVNNATKSQAYEIAIGEAMGKVAATAVLLGGKVSSAETLLADARSLHQEVMSSDILTSTEFQIRKVAEHLAANGEFIAEVEGIDECRICFRETEGTVACQGNRFACSGWSKEPSWSAQFRDDTDNRAGGCTYQWRLECR